MRLYKSGILTAISLALMAQVNCQASEPLPIAKSETAQSEQKSTLAPWEQLMEKATEAHNKNQFDSALSLARQALKILQDGGKRDRDLTFVMETVGLFTYEKGNYKEADEIIERAMEINIALSGRKSRVVVNNLNMLGRIKRHEKDLPEAKKLTQEAITIASQLKDNGTPDEATLTHNLGRIYQEENDFEHAKECYLKAIELTEKAGKSNTDAYVTYKQNLGTLYLKNGNLDKAKELMDSSLKLKESLGHANDKNTAFIKGNLAQVAIKQGDTERAKELYKGAIGILAKGVDPNKQHLAKFMDAYGDLLDDINNPQTKTTKTVSKAITDRDLGENVTFEQIKNEPYLPPLNFKPSIIKLLVKKNPENLLTDFKSDPIEAAKQIKNAPLFVFAYLSMITKHLENGTRPTFISPDEWNITVEKWKKERANENNLRRDNSALLYSIHPELGMAEVERIQRRNELRAKVTDLLNNNPKNATNSNTRGQALIPDAVLQSAIASSKDGLKAYNLHNTQITFPKSWMVQTKENSITASILSGAITSSLSVQKFDSEQNLDEYIAGLKSGLAKGLGIGLNEIKTANVGEGKLGKLKCKQSTYTFDLVFTHSMEISILSKDKTIYCLILTRPEQVTTKVQPIFSAIKDSVVIK
ncbi:MAG: tetratricopeptide repeat protein [Candidatus Obscuribacter sp.]|nr:tetratricopeptide repeat protein [Candidatus Obscuribacter sp.]